MVMLFVLRWSILTGRPVTVVCADRKSAEELYKRAQRYIAEQKEKVT